MTAAEDGFDYDAEYGDENTPPSWFPGGHLPPDAVRMGLTHHVPEGAILDFAGKLDATKPYHRAAAWVLLAVFGLPVLFAVMRIFQGLSG
jgi:hypothetical protein